MRILSFFRCLWENWQEFVLLQCFIIVIILWLFNINVTVLPFDSTQGSEAPWFCSERIWVSTVVMISKMVFVDVNVSVASNSFVSVWILWSPVLAGYPLCCVVDSALIVAPFRFANDFCNWNDMKYVNEICQWNMYISHTVKVQSWTLGSLFSMTLVYIIENKILTVSFHLTYEWICISAWCTRSGVYSPPYIVSRRTVVPNQGQGVIVPRMTRGPGRVIEWRMTCRTRFAVPPPPVVNFPSSSSPRPFRFLVF